MPVLKDYMNVREAAELLKVHPGTVKRLCRERKLSAYKVHNGWLIHIDEVQLFAKGYDGRRGRPSNNTQGKERQSVPSEQV
jgi:excisionase family DNA binding protein